MAGTGEELSDDEVFFGKMTLKEVKKHIWLNHGQNRTPNLSREKQDRKSIQIIETHSQPNLRSMPVDTPSPPASARDTRKSDESFIQMENLVSKLCMSPEKTAGLELNNTLEIIDYILKNGPSQNTDQPDKSVEIKKDDKIDTTQIKIEKDIKIEKNCLETPLPKKSPKKELAVGNNLTPKTKVKSTVKASPKYYTPVRSPKKQVDVFSTPSSTMKSAKTPMFKTPTNPLKKPSVLSLRSTPCKSPMYKHIKSPIATYIKGSIEVPMITNVCPKKPLPGGSMIPKFVKKTLQEPKQSKENMNLPISAYKSAKKTKVVNEADEEKPKSQVAKKLLAKLPHPPVILKHESKQFSAERKPLILLQEDSIADLSCLQADVSVCTQLKPIKK